MKQKNKCRHKNRIDLNKYRRNCPHGRKSSSIYSFKKKIGEMCINCKKKFYYKK